VDGSVITEDYEPCTQTMPPPNNNSIVFNTSFGLTKWYPDVWRTYCRALGSAITKRSLYGFAQRCMVGYQARNSHAETSALMPDGTILAQAFETPIADFVLV
jgi:hypothetical protein